MKTKKLSVALFLCLVFFSCSYATKEKSNENPNDCTEYACPMHPDHTSATPTKCPECNMDMEKVKKTHELSDSAKSCCNNKK